MVTGESLLFETTHKFTKRLNERRINFRLKNSDKVPRSALSNTTLGDVLDYLGGKCWVDFARISNDKVELSLTEIPEFHKD